MRMLSLWRSPSPITCGEGAPIIRTQGYIPRHAPYGSGLREELARSEPVARRRVVKQQPLVQQRLAGGHDGVEEHLQTQVLLPVVEIALETVVVGLQLHGGLAAGGEAVEGAERVELSEHGLGVADPLDEPDLLREACDAL